MPSVIKPRLASLVVASVLLVGGFFVTSNSSLVRAVGEVEQTAKGSITTGRTSSCAITSTGGLKCWGNNTNFQLGDGTTVEKLTPTDVPTLTSGVAAVDLGGNYGGCALLTTGGVKCWGSRSTGGATDSSSVPIDVIGLTSGVKKITVGDQGACAITNAGAAKCWGWNGGHGRFGLGNTNSPSTPVDIPGLSSGVQDVAIGAGAACFVTSIGAVKCAGQFTWTWDRWWANGPAYTKYGTSLTDIPTLSSGFVQVAVGYRHACARTNEGAVKCWGLNLLGDGTNLDNGGVPVSVSGLDSGVKDISVAGGGSSGNESACAITETNQIKCWGVNANGALGNNNTGANPALSPSMVTGINNAVALTTDVWSTSYCALLSTGAMTCWGDNAGGKLGDGTFTPRAVPAPVTALSTNVGPTTTTTTTSTTTTTTTTTTSTTTTTTVPRTTTTTASVAPTSSTPQTVTIDVQAPATTVATGQASIATIAPNTSESTNTRQNRTNVATTTTTAPVQPTESTTTTSVAEVQQRNSATSQAPVIAQVAPGETALTIGGISTTPNITRENNQLVISSGPVRASISSTGKSGKVSPLDSDGNLRLRTGDLIKLNVGGFKPSSDVDVWLYSTPTNLGSASVGPKGTVVATFAVPTNIDSGAHRLAVVAKLPNGKSATFAVGLFIGDVEQTSTLTRVLIAIPIALAIAAGLILPNQARRRRRRNAIA